MIEVIDDDSGPGNRCKQNMLPTGGRFSTINVDGKYPDTSTGRGDGNGNGNGGGERPAASPVTGGRPFAAQAFVLEQRFELKFGVDPDFMEKVARIRSLLSSKHHRQLDLEEFFSILMDEYIERHSPEGRIRRKTRREQKRLEQKKSLKATDSSQAVSNKKRASVPAIVDPRKKEISETTSACPQKKEGSRHIPQKVRDEVYARDKGCCSYRSPGGRKCGSKWDLQVDHIVPFARGGDNSPENLRLLCGKHNRLEAERAYGTKHMEQYVKESGVQYPTEQYRLEKTDMKPENSVKEDRGQYHCGGSTEPVPYRMKKPGRRASKLYGWVYFESAC
jgi:5-methylcytosine-specific restriction endonuclease McrA